MLTVLLGPDDFSKKEYVANMEKAEDCRATFFLDPDDLPLLESLVQTDLFSKKQLYVLRDSLAKFNSSESVAALVSSKNQILFLENKLDRRAVNNKKLLADSSVKIKEFFLPHGRELDEWLQKRASALGANLSAPAASVLARSLGRDLAKETRAGGKIVAVEEVYDLWQADSELRKLSAYAQNREITAEDIQALVFENNEVDVFELTNAIADGERQKTLQLLDKFLSRQAGGEEKGAVIQLNALLSEQFRNVAMVRNFLSRKMTEKQILEITGWKSGRLFVMKKISTRFAEKTILSLLAKLKALDEELKSGSVPPRVLLDLIITQLWKE